MVEEKQARCEICNWEGYETDLVHNNCPDCDSSHIHMEEEGQLCSYCNGSGISPSGMINDKCSHCNGTGVEH